MRGFSSGAVLVVVVVGGCFDGDMALILLLRKALEKYGGDNALAVYVRRKPGRADGLLIYVGEVGNAPASRLLLLLRVRKEDEEENCTASQKVKRLLESRDRGIVVCSNPILYVVC